MQQTGRHLEQQVAQLEAALLARVEAHDARKLPLLCSIPGIGRKTAAQLLSFTDGFTQVQSYRQLIAKAGLCPRQYQSGTSVRGQTRITKRSGARIRGNL
ncbi:MAG: IS110 family transposase [Hymenobacter sp.]|nr:MAG: IS110 family transposase [Hymenobacter sp.]